MLICVLSTIEVRALGCYTDRNIEEIGDYFLSEIGSLSSVKKREKALIATLTIVLLVPLTSVTQANAPSPGSASDPVITKSYFDQNSLTQDQVKQLISAEIAKIPSSGNGNGGSNGQSTGSFAGSSSLTVVQLKAGQTLYAGAGTEFIVRTGKTVAVSNDEDGIPDVTSGKDIPAGAAIENNHHLIFPRDTRGIKPATNNTADIFVMVRGSYSLFNADGSKVTT
jgi:hypothetical protein